MTAFISHSSKDKPFVRQVVDQLGSMQIEFDEVTFDYCLNVQAIRQALKRSSLVAFFVSENSISSSFINEEQRQALEALGRADIKRVLIFVIDNTSYRALPDWMREINVIQKSSNPKACARRIQSALVEIDSASPISAIYLGRDDQETDLRRAVAVPRSNSPLVLHVSGFHGVGRRTFISKSLNRILPRYYDAFIEVPTSKYQGIEDVYRALYQLQIVSSLKDTLSDFQRFSALDLNQQALETGKLIRDLVSDGGMLLFVDDFGVFDEEGDYQNYWAEIISSLSDMDRPCIAFIQNRVQPFRFKNRYPRAFHVKLGELSDTVSKELIALSLREESIEFNNDELGQLANLVDGHPFNLRFVVGYARHYGLANFLQDPRDFIEWKHRRGEDFLKKLEFSELAISIVSALAEYGNLSAELLIIISETSTELLQEELRNLQDYCCVEFRNGFFHLSSPIREATRRDRRFMHDDAWHSRVAQVICDVIQEYTEDDGVPLGLLEAATIAQVRGGAAPAYLKSLVLPSHLLMIAREHYDAQLRPQCIEFCKRAYDMKGRMTSDAQVETLRLWGLSAARSNDPKEYNFVIGELKTFNYPTAARNGLFLEGFIARIRGQLDIAEKKFKDAWDIAPKNAHINRELASLYCRQRRYSEAEQYARSTYEIQKTNPYIIDILLETLIGKKSLGQNVDQREINRLRDELKSQSHETETLFYNLREAQILINSKDYNGAILQIDEAIGLNAGVPGAYFLGVEAELGRKNIIGAEDRLHSVKDLLRRQGQSEGDECKLVEAEITILLEKQQFVGAKAALDSARGIPAAFLSRLGQNLARAIMFDTVHSTPDLNVWAKQQLKNGLGRG